MNYEKRLEALGYVPACAVKIVREYRNSDNLDALIEYIECKENEKQSIMEHVSEVIG